MSLTHLDVLYAAQRLRHVAVRTPVLSSSLIDDLVGRRVSLKMENHQLTGSFKFRGAYTAVGSLPELKRKAGVIGASSGNHGQALALAARLLGASATVVLPDDAPAAKRRAIEALRARVVTYRRGVDNRDITVQEIAHRERLTVVPSSDHPAVIAGAGTAALEMLQALPDLAAILVPVGGGGLAAGTAIAARAYSPRLKVFGVEPVTANDTQRSLRAGHRIRISTPATIADGLRHTEPAPMPFAINQQYLTDVITVPEGDIVEAMASLWRNYKVVAEPSGAVAFAGLLRAAHRLPEGRIGVIVSGGNVDWGSYRTMLDIAIDRQGRRIHAAPVLR
ncbi:threonine/serine dehydratase [Streptomyces sp. CRPSP2-6A1]|uniref:threonine ammonia-lyase n=1 Tax=Streptomyces sp. CRPSP2-6A1 TaxID=2799588 RepID=UPI001F3A1369|nr:threonine/serine dehydratase [Streptomyces sp. CRPSP2-6A1]